MLLIKFLVIKKIQIVNLVHIKPKTEKLFLPSTSAFSEPGLNIGPVRSGIESYLYITRELFTTVSRMRGKRMDPTDNTAYNFLLEKVN